MTATNRQTKRERIAAILTTNLVGAGKPVSVVYAYQKSKLDVSPVLLVMSSGSERNKNKIGSTLYRNRFGFEIHSLIRDTDDSGLTEQQREDRLDLIDKMIADTVAQYESDNEWDRLYFSGNDSRNGEATPSKATKVMIDGKPFILEIFNVEVLCND